MLLDHPYRVDTLDPWVFHLPNGMRVRWYGVACMLGFLIAFAVWTRWARRGRLPLHAEDVSALLLYALAGVVIGGRLGYCLFYNLDEVFRHPQEIIALWHGGMASHGGILDLIVSVYIFARTRRVDPWLLLDAAASVGPLGITLGRIANFINGDRLTARSGVLAQGASTSFAALVAEVRQVSSAPARRLYC